MSSRCKNSSSDSSSRWQSSSGSRRTAVAGVFFGSSHNKDRIVQGFQAERYLRIMWVASGVLRIVGCVSRV